MYSQIGFPSNKFNLIIIVIGGTERALKGKVIFSIIYRSNHIIKPRIETFIIENITIHLPEMSADIFLPIIDYQKIVPTLGYTIALYPYCM